MELRPWTPAIEENHVSLAWFWDDANLRALAPQDAVTISRKRVFSELEESHNSLFAEIVDADETIDLEPSKLKKRWRRLKNRLPPIIKRDIRRLLPTMLINVCNSVDENLIARFFLEYGLACCCLMDHCGGNAKTILPSLTSIGLNNVISNVRQQVTSSVDFVSQMDGAEIYRELYQPGSRVVMRTKIQGTKIIHKHPCDHEHTYNDEQVVISAAAVEIVMKIVVTLFLDNNHRIYRLLLQGAAEYL
eukprot:gene3858-4215_t